MELLGESAAAEPRTQAGNGGSHRFLEAAPGPPPVVRKRGEAHRAVLALAGIIALAAAPRLFGLSRQNLIYDECASVLIARMHWRDFFAVLSHREANMSLYYLLLRGWMAALAAWFPAWARTEPAVRLLSVGLGLAEFPVLFALGRRLYNARAGLMAALLLAPNILALRYSQDARSYSLYLLLVTAAALQFLRAGEAPPERQARGWAFYTVLAAAAVYAQFFAGIFLLMQWLWRLLERGRRPAGKGFWLSLGAILLLVSPLLAFVLLRNRGQIAWVPAPNFGQITGLLQAMAGEGAHTVALLWPLAWVWLALAVLGLWAGLRRRNAAPAAIAAPPPETGAAAGGWNARRATLLLALWLWLPIALVYAGSYLWEPMFINRYLLPCLVPWALLAACGLQSLRPRLALPVALALLLGMQAAADVSYYHHLVPPWRQASRYLQAHYRPGDRILAYQPGGAMFLDYYFYRDHREELARSLLYPASANPARLLRKRGIGERAMRRAVAQLRRLPTGSRLWFAMVLDDKSPAWAQRLPQPFLYFDNQPLPDYIFMGERRFYAVHVMLYRKIRAGPPLDLRRAQGLRGGRS